MLSNQVLRGTYL